MSTPRRSEDVINLLLSTMSSTVTSYHPTVRRTGHTLEGLIAGTACFPGGSGLWQGERNGGPLPNNFPTAPVMFVGHNFDSEAAFAASFLAKGEAGGNFWQRLLAMLRGAGLSPDGCFFSNALMGLKPGSATGPMPRVPGYREQCSRFLAEQVKMVQPSAVVALGKDAVIYVSKLAIPWTEVKHPSNWDFRASATREEMLLRESRLIREFLNRLLAG